MDIFPPRASDHKGRIISSKFSLFGSPKGYEVTFMDYLLLLPSSLRAFCKSFSVENPKSYFPHLLNNINYQGSVPLIKYFKGISPDEYKEYKDSFDDKIWYFKREAQKYCEIDCISLY